MTEDVEKALEGAEAEDTVLVSLRYTTGNQIGGKPQVVGMVAEVTLSGLMEVQAILERGGLVEQGSVVNEAEAAVTALLERVGGGEYETRLETDWARDIVAVLAEHGLLRKGA